MSLVGQNPPPAVHKRDIYHIAWRYLTTHRGVITLVLTAFVGANLALQRMWGWNLLLAPFDVAFAVLTIAIPWVLTTTIAWARGLSTPIDTLAQLDGESASSWVDGQFQSLLARRGLLISALTLAAVGLLCTVRFWIGWRGPREIPFLLWAGIFFFGYGVLAWGWGALIVLIWRISNLTVQCSPFRWPTEQAAAIYKTYFRILILGASLYGLAVLSVWISPGGSRYALGTRVGMLWVFPPAACVILFFLVFHLSIHRLLLRFKQFSDNELTTLLDAEYQQWVQAPTSEREDRIEKLLEWREHVRRAEEWPLGLHAVLLTVTTLLLPTIKEIIDLLAK